MATKRKDILVYEIPPAVRTALSLDAQAQNVSLNEAAVKILAGHYGVLYAPSGKTFKDGGGPNLAIRGGRTLHRRISIDAAKRGGTLRGVVLEILALHYQLEPEPIGRRPRRTPTKGE